MRIVYVDAETRYDIGAPTADGTPGTFKDPAKLGLTVACTAENDGPIRDWTVEEQEDLRWYLREVDLAVGFNSFRFDLALIGGVKMGKAFYKFLDGAIVDLFMDLQDKVGMVKGTGLKPLAKWTLGFEPKEDVTGAYAPQLWREGKKLEVIDYCRSDVQITRDLFMHGFSQPLKFLDVRRGSIRFVRVTWKRRNASGQPVENVTLNPGQAELPLQAAGTE